MTICDRTQQRLNALTDCELSPWVAAGVRRHLKSCESCRADYLLIQNISSQFREWRETSVPEHLSPRIANAVAHSAVTAEPAPAIARRLRWQPYAALAGAAAITLGLALMPINPPRSTVTFAQVQQAMQKVATASWTMDITADSPSLSRWHENTHRVERVWVQEYPPIIIRQVKNGGIMVWNEEGFQRYKVSRGHYKLIDHRSSHGVADNVETMLRKLTERPGDVEHSAIGETAGVWQQRAAEISGRAAIRYTRTVFLSNGHSHRTRSTDEASPSRNPVDKRTYLRTETVWADPKTKRLLRSEERWGPSFPTHVTCKDFEYSQPIPTDLVNIRNGSFAQQAHWP